MEKIIQNKMKWEPEKICKHVNKVFGFTEGEVQPCSPFLQTCIVL